MRLAAASKRFDKLLFVDAYGGYERCYGHLDPYNGSRTDGLVADRGMVSVERRIITVAPTLSLPARGAVQVPDGRVYLVGRGSLDYYFGKPIRKKYVTQPADGLVGLYTLDGLLSGSAEYSTYASVVAGKTEKESDSSAEVLQWGLIFANPEDPDVYDVATYGGKLFFFRSMATSPVLLHEGSAEEVAAVAQVAYTVAGFDPVADQVTGTPIQVSALRLRWQTAFLRLSGQTTTYQVGDAVYAVSTQAVTAPKRGDLLVDGGHTWVVQGAYVHRSGANILHVRRKS